MSQTTFDQGQTRLASLPSFAWIAVTNKCNLDCAHCQRGLLKGQGLLKPREMSWRVFSKLESELFPHLTKIQFGGNNLGEQLLASNWDSFIDRVIKLNIEISIVSNGILLNKERIKKMVDAGVEFNFSLEGITGESYEKVRGCSFEKFLGVVKETCQEKINRSESGARVNLGFMLYSDNVQEITKLMGIAARIGIDRITINHFYPWQENQRQKSLVYHKEIANQMIMKAERLARELGLIVDIPSPFRTDNNHGISNPLDSNPLKPCYHPWNSVSIDENGNVMPCCATSVVMGNLERSSFTEIWHGWKYQKLRKTVNSSMPMSFCRNCAFRGIEIRSNKPLSFCSDEKILLAAIGSDIQTDSYRLMLRKIKKGLGKTSLGRKLVPYLMELYYRHGAFFV